MKVLAVEDDPVARLLLRAELVSLGHEVVVADDGGKAWDALQDRSIRVVISDWRLPQLDGLSLCRRVRETRDDYVCFLLLTECTANEANLSAAITAGVDEFLTKPVSSLDLRMRLHAAARTLEFTTEVRKLRSFLPICCYCKRVRNDQDYWLEIEKYLSQQQGTTVSHGVCPTCYSDVLGPQLSKFGISPPPYRARGGAG